MQFHKSVSFYPADWMASSQRDLPEERLPSPTDVCKGKCDTDTSRIKKWRTAPFSRHHFREEKEREKIKWKMSQNTTAKGEILSSSSFSETIEHVPSLHCTKCSPQSEEGMAFFSLKVTVWVLEGTGMYLIAKKKVSWKSNVDWRMMVSYY
jgi:hypothetical protein